MLLVCCLFTIHCSIILLIISSIHTFKDTFDYLFFLVIYFTWYTCLHVLLVLFFYTPFIITLHCQLCCCNSQKLHRAPLKWHHKKDLMGWGQRRKLILNCMSTIHFCIACFDFVLYLILSRYACCFYII